jgi:hypothetical protein
MSKKPPQGISATTKFFLGVIVLLVIALAVVYGWKVLAVRGASEALEVELARLTEQTRGALVDQTREMLMLSAVPLSWSVRTEMIKENYDQIDDYMQRFVKEPHVNLVVLVNHEGSVQIATDKKLEGQAAHTVFPPGVLEVSRATVIEPEDSGEILAAVPILSYDARLGTLVVVYSMGSIDSKLAAP